MILISDEDYMSVQVNALSQGFGDFLKKLETSSLDSSEYDEPKAYVIELVKFALIGYQNYINLYDYVNKIILDINKLNFFKEPHTKEEVRKFVGNLN